MNREELLKLHENMSTRSRNLMAEKNHDYTGGQDATDAFANFRAVEAMNITDSLTGLMTRMSDKFCRLGTLCKGRKLKVKTESVEDTLLDIINYSVLAMGLVMERERGEPGGKL